MNADTPETQKLSKLHFAFDVGHSSIGWAVLETRIDRAPELIGCGTVIFPADDCLASQRRQFRRQRRHIRATRLRIARMKMLLMHLCVMTEAELNGVTSSAPWLLAARVMTSDAKLSWPELWDVLRWYAHNRGYDGNRRWSSADAQAEAEDTEKEKTAIGLMETHGTNTMAETLCKELGLSPDGDEHASMKRFKGLNAAFPRGTVVTEVARLLHAHAGYLRHVDGPLADALLSNWRVIPCEGLKLPKRYEGGLLFGQLVPRFENRIIATCPIQYEREYVRALEESDDVEKAKHVAEKLAKVPAANCVEFFRYRWAMQVANILVHTPGSPQPRRLSADERNKLDARMRDRGAITKGEFREAIEELAGKVPSNVKQMLLHPDAERALVVDPAQRVVTSREIAPYFAVLPERLQKRIRGQLRRGKKLWLGALRLELEKLGDVSAFDVVLAREVEVAETKRSKKVEPVTREKILERRLSIESMSGRAPHSREVMRDVVEFVFSTDKHPAEEGGPLYRSEAIRRAQLQRVIDEQTNNHLVRHRLKLLERLHADLLKTYAEDDKTRVRNITIEVNRGVKELSGKSAQEIAKELGRRLGNFKGVVERLEKDLEGKGIPITPGLIRKARIAEDLGWKCPYTGASYDALDLAFKRVDKDHIVPRSERPSDSLDSLVITFPGVNKMKGKRTGVLFVEQEQSKPVPDAPRLSIKPLATYLADVEKLETFKGHPDDQRRKRNRKRLLLLRDYVEKEFTPGDLTKTSQLVRLGAQALERQYLGQEERPVITSLPGFLTGAVRKSWEVLACLEAANKEVMNPETGQVRTKTEIRDITHLHHALDACTLVFARAFLPRDGGAMELLAKRRLNSEDQKRARAFFKDAVEIAQDGEVRLAELPKIFKEQIRTRLAECRVVQHLPADLSGLRCKETVWRVFDPTDSHPNSRRLARWLTKGNVAVPSADAKTALIICRKRRNTDTVSAESAGGKVFHETKTWRWVFDIKDKSALLGLAPVNNTALAKLKRIKAVKVMGDNFGLALDPEPILIRSLRVWSQLSALRERNGGKMPRVLRIGSFIQVLEKVGSADYRGRWMVRGSYLKQKGGFMVDLSPADYVAYRRVKGAFEAVRVTTLIKCGIEVLKVPLCGVAFHVQPGCT